MVTARGGAKYLGNGKAVEWMRDHLSYAGDDCLQWPFSRDARVGRGRVGYRRKQYWAHRLMCIFAHGNPPTPKHQAAHTCGKGHFGCVNPRHLAWKTNSENQLDRRKNGSRLCNQNGSRTVLAPEQITEIQLQRGKEPQVALARRFGVSLGCIQYWQRKNRPPLPIGKKRLRQMQKAQQDTFITTEE